MEAVPRRDASQRWKLATEKVIKTKSIGKDKLRQTVKFVASIDDLERFVNIITGEITNLPTPGIATEEIEAQLLDLEVNNFYAKSLLVLQNFTIAGKAGTFF